MSACFALYPKDMSLWEKNVEKESEGRWKHDLADFCGEFFLLEKEGGNAEELQEGALTLYGSCLDRGCLSSFMIKDGIVIMNKLSDTGSHERLKAFWVPEWPKWMLINNTPELGIAVQGKSVQDFLSFKGNEYTKQGRFCIPKAYKENNNAG